MALKVKHPRALPLWLPQDGLSLSLIHAHLVPPEEGPWLARMTEAHGEKGVLRQWPKLQA